MSEDAAKRIGQWEQMVREAPDSMAWFSLGNAYRDAGRQEEAINAYRQALAYDEGLSRAYQALGQLLIHQGESEAAGELLEKGYVIAAEQGDVMPQRAMGKLLEGKLGRQPPEVEEPEAPEPEAAAADAETIVDRRSGKRGTRMAEPPMRGPLGAFIRDHFSLETWREWLGMGTKVINELKLDFSNPEHQEQYDRHMMEWLGISDDELEPYR